MIIARRSEWGNDQTRRHGDTETRRLGPFPASPSLRVTASWQEEDPPQVRVILFVEDEVFYNHTLRYLKLSSRNLHIPGNVYPQFDVVIAAGLEGVSGEGDIFRVVGDEDPGGVGVEEVAIAIVFLMALIPALQKRHDAFRSNLDRDSDNDHGDQQPNCFRICMTGCPDPSKPCSHKGCSG